MLSWCCLVAVVVAVVVGLSNPAFDIDIAHATDQWTITSPTPLAKTLIAP